MNLTSIKAAACLFLVLVAINIACAGKIDLKQPVKLPDDQTLRAVYFFPHWWDPWKSDDHAIVGDLRKMKDLGFNTVCLDHEVSQAIDREWYWLDREYKLAGQEKVYVLPWLQLQAMDRISLMKFSHLQLEQAVGQDGQPEEDCAHFRDSQFKQALAHYVSVYLDRYGDDPALLRIKDKGKLRPVVGLVVEAGWRNPDGLPLSFDEETNAYFRKWMKATYHNLNELNSKWGTSYKSFDEIDPCDSAVFNYALEDGKNVPMAVREHVRFRARLIGEALQDVARQVRKRHGDVLFVAEVAYPFGVDHPDANAYRWNNANDYKAVDFADIIFIRTVGNTSSGEVQREQEMLMLNGKKVILAYRLFDDCSTQKAVALALDCAASANGLGCYSWNETADESSAIYNKPDRQVLAQIMASTYDMLYDVDKRHAVTSLPPVVDGPEIPAVPGASPVPLEPAITLPTGSSSPSPAGTATAGD